MAQRAVMIGLLVETEEHKKQLAEGFKEWGFVPPKIIHSFKTLEGEGGDGGRTDILVEFDDKDIPRLAVHPVHLQGGFSWEDDYLRNHRSIIPKSAMQFFTKPEFEKPVCKLIGADGNTFNLAGIVIKTLRKAGYPEKIIEFSDRLTQCHGYDAALTLIQEYVEVE